MNVPAIIGIVIMIIGFSSFMIFFLFQIKNIKQKTIGYKKTQGKVIDFIRTKGYSMYFPLVKYIVDNQEYEVVGNVSYKGLFKPKKLTVLYNPHNPKFAEVKDEKNFLLRVVIIYGLVIIYFIWFIITKLL